MRIFRADKINLVIFNLDGVSESRYTAIIHINIYYN